MVQAERRISEEIFGSQTSCCVVFFPLLERKIKGRQYGCNCFKLGSWRISVGGTIVN